MEAKTFSRFFPKLAPIMKDSKETQPLFFTLHSSTDCNMKQIPISTISHQLIIYQSIIKYCNDFEIGL